MEGMVLSITTCRLLVVRRPGCVAICYCWFVETANRIRRASGRVGQETIESHVDLSLTRFENTARFLIELFAYHSLPGFQFQIRK